MSDTDPNNEFINALNTEMGIEPITPPAADPVVPPVTPPADPVVPPVEPPADPVTPPAPELNEDGTPKVVEPVTPPEPELDENGKPKVVEAPKVDEPPKFATKEDIAAALREDRESIAQQVEKVTDTRDAIINIIHPEGIDKNVYDSNGQVIKTAQDIVDRGLFKPGTEEPFTYEEAASWLLSAQQQTNKNVAELEQYAENLGELNVSFVESNHRVMEQWGDILKAMPTLADELATKYVQTQVKFDKTGQYVVSVGMTPEDYYQLTLAPYKQLGEQMATNQQAADAQAAKEKAEAEAAEQAERNGGIPPQRGTSNVKSNTGDPMLDALVDELATE